MGRGNAMALGEGVNLVAARRNGDHFDVTP